MSTDDGREPPGPPGTGGSRPTPSDEALLGAASTDAEAFGVFYDRNEPLVLAYFYRRIYCPHTAADLTAETFAGALEGLHRFRPDRGTAKAWLFGIAGNQFRQWLRKGRVSDRARRRLGLEPVDLLPGDFDRIEALADVEPMRSTLAAALDELSPALRDAVVLRVAYELPYDEVARRLGCSVGAARVRVARALTQLTLGLEAT